MPAPTPDTQPADDAERIGHALRPAPSGRRHARLPVSRRRSLPWSERSILVGSVLMVTISAPVWLDPLTLNGLLGFVPPGPTQAPTPLLPGRFDGPTAQPASPSSRVVAADTFSRRVGAGWGSADLGGTYEPAGRASGVAVQPGVGIVELSGAEEGELVLPVAARDLSVEFSVALDRRPAGGEIDLRIVLRRTADDAAILPAVHIASNGSVTVGVSVTLGGAADPLGGRFAVRDLDAADGAVLRIRAEASGSDPTTVRLRAWPASAPEPSYWHVSVIEWAGALQAAGAAGLGWRTDTGTGELTLSFDDLIVTTTDGGQP